MNELKTIKNIYEGYFNTSQDVEIFAVEFFFAVGSILQGTELKDLKLEHLTVEDLK